MPTQEVIQILDDWSAKRVLLDGLNRTINALIWSGHDTLKELVYWIQCNHSLKKFEVLSKLRPVCGTRSWLSSTVKLIFMRRRAFSYTFSVHGSVVLVAKLALMSKFSEPRIVSNSIPCTWCLYSLSIMSVLLTYAESPRYIVISPQSYSHS